MDALYVDCCHVTPSGHHCAAKAGQYCEERFNFFHQERLVEAEFGEEDFTPMRCVDWIVEDTLLA